MEITGFTAAVTCVLVGSFGIRAFGQTTSLEVPTSVNARLVLDAAGPEQRKSLSAVYLIACPDSNSGGSGFLLNTGTIITNSHVVSTCTEKTLFGISTASKKVTFSRIIKDADRDLALLVPTEKLTNGLKLAATDRPEPGITVTTWGYPFFYNGASPLLSVGYVSGFREVKSADGKTTVKHIVVNGAFNHGNSGGPLLIAHDSEVIGVVVSTYNFYPVEVKQIIDALSKQNSGFQMGSITRRDGSKESLSEARVTAMVLDEFYQKTQVMIGEAIGASELVAMLKEHASELPAGNGSPKTVPPTKATVQKKPRAEIK